MAITAVGSSWANGTYDPATQTYYASPALPSGIAVGDLMILWTSTSNPQSGPIIPSGWQQVAKPQPDISGAVEVYTNTQTIPFSRRYQAGDVAPKFRVASNNYGAVLVVLRGTDGVDVAALGAWSSPVAPSVTPTKSPDLLLACAGTNSTYVNSGTCALSAPPDMQTEVARHDSPGYDTAILVVSKQLADTTATGDKTFSASRTDNYSRLSGSQVALYAWPPPNAPTLTGPANNQPIDRTITQRFTWQSSQAAGDSQSKADVRFSTDNGTTWSTQTVMSPSQYLDMPSGSFAAGSWQWQVRTYGSTGLQGPWSASSFFTAAAPANAPSITYPTSGGTVNQAEHVDWSFASAQQSYQVQRVGDSSGLIDTSTVYYDTGEVVDANARTLPLTFTVNNRYEWIRVRVKSGGLWTSWAQIRVQVSYTPPPAATGLTFTTVTEATLDGVQVAKALDITWTTSAPTGSQPAATGATLEISGDAGQSVEYRRTGLAISTTHRFPTPASGRDYSARVTTSSDNGLTALSGWVA